MKNKKGFTLIELVITIALILVLFLVVVPIGTNLIQKSNNKQCETIIEDILANAELYRIDNNLTYEEVDEMAGFRLRDMYVNGYLEEEYDLKNGNVINTSNMDVIYVHSQCTGNGCYLYIQDDLCN